ncbi:hypothetical protein AU467_23865 [Mesorhizobium loti]|uniref:Uncharacterized protein n=1 Tax=Rhizobium loti TaxID=381 RepID=A0A124GG77_RHILI|nr:hypothetical protein AU467_23865 [Mesorhizobium loti]
MFWYMSFRVRRDSSIVAARSVTRLCRTSASAVSSATSVPPPTAMPTSAAASAGASLMPSPNFAIFQPVPCASRTARSLAQASFRHARQASGLSRSQRRPTVFSVSITGSMPASFNASSPACASMRGGKRVIGDNHFMDHTSTVHVVRPDGTHASTFLSTASPSDMAMQMRKLFGRG